MAVLDDLTANVTKITQEDDAIIQLLSNIKAKLDAALAAGGGVDVAALKKLSDSLGSEADKVAASVLANTPAATLDVTGVSPNSGPLAGGTAVVISGTGLSGVTGVKFGGVPAASFAVQNDTTVNATSPAGTSVGSVDILVSTAKDTSSAKLADQFSYT